MFHPNVSMTTNRMSQSPRHSHRHFAATVIGLLIAWFSFTATAQAASPYEVAGIQGALRNNVEAYLSTLELPCGSPRWQADAWMPRAHTAARKALEALGYYNSSIKDTLRRQNNCWRVRMDIQAGPPVRITQLDIAATGPGRNAPGLKALLAHPGLRLHEILDQGAYDALKSRLERYVRGHGYFDAKFTAHEILVDPISNTARIRLILNTGIRYRFGATALQQDVLNPRVVRGFLSYRQGQPYSSNTVVESQSALAASGYFSGVHLVTDVKQRAHGEVPMHLTLTPARRYQLLSGVGYSTDIGPSLRLDFHNRRVNRAGQRYTLSSQLSPVQSQLGFKYEIPLRNPRTDWLTLESGYQYEKTDTSLSHSWKLGVIRTHLLGNHWLQRLSLEYLREGSTVGGQSLTSQLLIPGIGFSRTVADAPLYPRRGWSVSTELRGAAKGLVSDASFSQLTLHLKDIYPLGSGRVFTRLSLGATAVSNITLLPASLRFFAGGVNSVRGYAYQSLGPRDSEGNIIGGKYLATAGIEYDHRLYGNFYWAVFYDVGNAFNTLPLHPRRGVGLGLRWHSPIGPIRLDIAHPLDSQGNYLRLGISMGPEL